MEDKIKIYVHFAKQFHDQCMLERKKFYLNEHNVIYEGKKDGDFRTRMYYGSEHDSWAFICGPFEYRSFGKSFMIELVDININDMELYLTQVNEFLSAKYDEFSKRTIGAVKRKLVF